MKTKLLIFSIPLACLLACSKDDGPKSPEPDPIEQQEKENKAPETFSLLSPDMDTENEARSPIFIWDPATDPDGDKVTYDLYLDTSEEPATLIAESLSAPIFEIEEDLKLDTTFFWKVVAKDDKGAETSSETASFTTEFPLAFLTEYERHLGGGKGSSNSLKIRYFEDKITIFGNFFVNYEDQFGHISSLVRDLSDIRFEYLYSDTGMQTLVESFGVSTKKITWAVEHGAQAGPLRIFRSEAATAGTAEFVATFVYDSTEDVRPREIHIEYEYDLLGTQGDGLTNMRITWEDQNISSIAFEGLENGAPFKGRTVFTYDDNINPYYVILKEQFGFEDFFISNLNTGMETFDSGIFYWQSRNNPTKIEFYSQEDDEDPYMTKSYTYTYSDAYYPLSGTEQITEGMATIINEFTWKY